MRHEPLFSVVIPTRNRAHLVRDAIKSVLGQTFDDYELVVSDNCSEDGAADVIRETGGDRVRYVRPPRVLAMPDHWEFAIEQARGRFVTYLGDDDVLAPGALARVSEALNSSGADLVALYSGIYYSPDWLDPKQQNVALFLPFTGGVREHRSDDTIRRLFGECRVVNEAPRMLNSFCRRETLQRVRAEVGRIFMLCPDYSFSAMILTQVPTWLYIDEPLHLQGVVPEGIGSTQVFNRGEPSLEFIREFDEYKPLSNVPLKSLLVSNLITDTLLLAKKRLPALGGYAIDWGQYFISCWYDILTLERNGVDTAADKEEFARALARQPAKVRERVRLVVEGAAAQSALRSAARKLINSSPLLANLEARVRHRDREADARLRERESAALALQPLWVSGTDAHFSNILECARMLPELASRESAAAAYL
jgi:hypothetical protein